MVAESDFLGAIAEHGQKLIDVTGRLDLDISVPTCPGWTVRDLVVHTATVYQHKAITVADGWVDSSPPRPTGLGEAGDAAVIDELQASLNAVLIVLEQADLSKPTYTWCDHEHTADWWVRRLAHESLIHAADAIVASGGTPDAEAWLAIDGVDEILDEMMVGYPAWATFADGTDRIDLTSGGRTWSLRSGHWSGASPTSQTVYVDEPAVVTDTNGAADATISADPQTLDYWLWGRAELPADAVNGDRTLAAFVRGVAASATG